MPGKRSGNRRRPPSGALCCHACHEACTRREGGPPRSLVAERLVLPLVHKTASCGTLSGASCCHSCTPAAAPRAAINSTSCCYLGSPVAPRAATRAHGEGDRRSHGTVRLVHGAGHLLEAVVPWSTSSCAGHHPKQSQSSNVCSNPSLLWSFQPRFALPKEEGLLRWRPPQVHEERAEAC